MLEQDLRRIGVALALTVGLCACNGKPEDTGQGAASAAAVTSTRPAPPYPTWTQAMLGKDLKQVSRGTVTCKGVVDTVSAKYTGVHPGSVIEGWAWNEQAHRPLTKVVFTDASGRIVGGANEGNPRPDVVQGVPEIKSAAVGWKGVARPTSGMVTAVGLAEDGSSCVLGDVSL